MEHNIWITNYLIPLLKTKIHPEEMSMLQVFPEENDNEAETLRNIGFQCEVASSLEMIKSNYRDRQFDFIFTGRFCAMTNASNTRNMLAGELSRVLKPDGSILLSVPNKKCLIDLTRNTSLLHKFNDSSCINKEEVRELFPDFEITLLPVNGHFQWSRLPKPFKFAGHIFDFFWKSFAKPQNPIIYQSVLNPVLNIWLKKNEIVDEF